MLRVDLYAIDDIPKLYFIFQQKVLAAVNTFFHSLASLLNHLILVTHIVFSISRLSTRIIQTVEAKSSHWRPSAADGS